MGDQAVEVQVVVVENSLESAASREARSLAMARQQVSLQLQLRKQAGQHDQVSDHDQDQTSRVAGRKEEMASQDRNVKKTAAAVAATAQRKAACLLEVLGSLEDAVENLQLVQQQKQAGSTEPALQAVVERSRRLQAPVMMSWVQQQQQIQERVQQGLLQLAFEVLYHQKQGAGRLDVAEQQQQQQQPEAWYLQDLALARLSAQPMQERHGQTA